MSDPPTSALVEVTTVPQNQPPAPAPPVKTPPGPSSGAAVPGVPLAVAVANALGGTVAGALSLGGPVALAVAGTAAGAAAIGGLARRSRTTRRHTPHTAARRAAAHHAAAPGGLFAPTAAGRAPRVGGVNSAAGSARYAPTGTLSAGRAAGPAASGGRPSVAPASSSVSRKGPSAMGRTAGFPSPARATGSSGVAGGPGLKPGKTRHRANGGAAHTLAKAASRLPGFEPRGGSGAGPVDQRAVRRDQRLAKVAERTARRVAMGQAKAERAAGIDPSTGAGAHPTGPSVLRGSGPSPVQAKALRRSAVRHRARMAGVAAATGLVGLASAAVGNWRHKGKVSGHMRRTWARMAARARAVRDARNAAILGTADPADTHTPGTGAGAVSVPVPAQYVNIPGRPTPTPGGVTGPAGTPGTDGPAFELFGRPSRPGTTPAVAPIALGKSTVKEPTVSDLDGNTTSTFNLTSAADVLLQAATTFDPETMIEFGTFADDLPTAFTTLQDVLRVLAEQAAERLPLDPTVVEEIGTAYRAMGAVVNALGEVAPTFRKAHAEDLERHENPRNGLDAERKWNV
ncbi:hypothetical protein ACFVUH_34505 [Kitasatospora sp. NPDC058032]|uniref:hypothetical protein n=1 Tax=Kitasatospora sp. NPDC058032 TaxID=3346307 RepID=UPI0036DC1EEA